MKIQHKVIGILGIAALAVTLIGTAQPASAFAHSLPVSRTSVSEHNGDKGRDKHQDRRHDNVQQRREFYQGQRDQYNRGQYNGNHDQDNRDQNNRNRNNDNRNNDNRHDDHKDKHQDNHARHDDNR